MGNHPEYGWRVQSYGIARGGFFATVEKWWCTVTEGPDSGWRWSGWKDGVPESRTLVSDSMSFDAAMAAATAWLNEAQVQDMNDNVYAFAGAEVSNADR